MTISKLHNLFLQCNSVCTDTRKIVDNCMFFALKGENFNGNTFAEKAIQAGAKFAIIDEEKHNTFPEAILVKNTLETLQELATYHRQYLGLKIIALTGSNGKTTTKELINAVISQKHKTVATLGNLNNHIGVPLTLLRMTKDTEIGIVEMGANHLKEIETLCNIALPDYGYITNFGKAHLEGFGSIEGVISGKSELYNYLTKNNKHIFFNADDDIQLEKVASQIKKIGFSTSKQDFFKITQTNTNAHVSLQFENTQIASNLIGNYNFTNLCAAVLMGKYFNVPDADIKKGIEAYIPKNNRSQIIKKGTLSIILDAYNANPTSMQAALKNLSASNTENKAAILGDMFELGKTAIEEHQHIVDYIKTLNLDSVNLIGEHFYKTEHEEKFNYFKSFEAFKAEKFKPLQNCTLLIKGSRGMALERVLDLL